jgi:hypothetical protein
MKNISLTLTLFILTGSFLYGQSLFDNLTNEPIADDSKKTPFELNGFTRGVVYGGSKDYDYSNVFGEFALKGRLEKQKAFLYADMRVREGLFYENRVLQLQLKEAYAVYRGD